MLTINMHEAKSQLSKLVEAAIAGEEVIIARNGQPTVRLVPINKVDVSKRIGGGRSLFTQAQLDQLDSMTLEEFNASDAEIEAMFDGSIWPEEKQEI